MADGFVVTAGSMAVPSCARDTVQPTVPLLAAETAVTLTISGVPVKALPDTVPIMALNGRVVGKLTARVAGTLIVTGSVALMIAVVPSTEVLAKSAAV